MSEAPPPASGPFELSGGSLCLDFANTWGDRGRPETDGLHTYDDLLVFVRQCGLLSERERSGLARRAAAGAARAFAAARELREAIYALAAAQARSRALPARDLDTVNRALRAAYSHLALERRGAAVDWVWTSAGGALDAPLWPIARSAAELLTSPDLARVRECDGATCTWLFLDRSRGGSRRWCSMASCGNRAKARRHYARRAAAG